MIYLDNASTTKVAPEVLHAMMPYLQEQYGNAGTLYALGRQAAAAVKYARKQVSRLFACSPAHIIFTSGGSESNNTVLKGISSRLKSRGKIHLILSAIEHDSVLKAANSLIKDGFYITYVYPDASGVIHSEDVEAAIRPDTGLVCVMFVNNEIGSVSDIRKIGQLCHDKSILFFSDCVQAAGQYGIDVDDFHLDYASISSHKLHGPKGVGAIYARNLGFSPLIYGGAEQEAGLRAGTENVAGIVGFGCACELALASEASLALRTTVQKREFFNALIDALPFPSALEAGIHVNGLSRTHPGKVLNLRIEGVSGETLVLMLDALGVCVSAGSACRSRESKPSHVLTAIGLSPEDAKSCVRISFSQYNTAEEIICAATAMADCIETLRASGAAQ